MRLWSLHPKYLDPKGLVALWREGLLARAVLSHQTRGYRAHPQIYRFQRHRSPMSAINAYLSVVYEEARLRGYHFDESKLEAVGHIEAIPVTTGQIAFEWQHLLGKLATRSPHLYEQWRDVAQPEPHPLFAPCPGSIESWEKMVRIGNRAG